MTGFKLPPMFSELETAITKPTDGAHEYRLTRIRPDGKKEVLHFVSRQSALERMRQAIRASDARPPKRGTRSRFEIHHKGELMLEVWHCQGHGWLDRGRWA